MKTRFYLSFLIAFGSILSNDCFSQDNEYLQNDPVWTMNSVCQVGLPCIADENYNYFLQGDSIIDGTIYKKVFKRGQGYYQWQSPEPHPGFCNGSSFYTNTSPEFLLRSSAKQMFIFVPGDTAEMLLYDFDLEVGDTLPVTYNNPPGVYVTAVDSFYTSAGYRKRFMLAGDTWSQFLIEGVGHSNGLREPMYLAFDCGFSLTCFSIGDSSFYPSQGPNCVIDVGIDERKIARKINVFPQPFSNAVTIGFGKVENDVQFTVYSVCGRKVKSLSNISGDQMQFERGDLKSGIYFYELKTDSGTFSSGKLAIVD